MKRSKTKAIDFVSMLRESILFSEHEIDGIASICGSTRTVPAIMAACDELQIGLTQNDVSQLCHMSLFES